MPRPERRPGRLWLSLVLTALVLTVLISVWGTGMAVGALVAEDDCFASFEDDTISTEARGSLFGWKCIRYAPGEEARSDTTWFWEYAYRLID